MHDVGVRAVICLTSTGRCLKCPFPLDIGVSDLLNHAGNPEVALHALAGLALDVPKSMSNFSHLLRGLRVVRKADIHRQIDVVHESARRSGACSAMNRVGDMKQYTRDTNGHRRDDGG